LQQIASWRSSSIHTATYSCWECTGICRACKQLRQHAVKRAKRGLEQRMQMRIPSLQSLPHVRGDTKIDKGIYAEDHPNRSGSYTALLRFCKAYIILNIGATHSANQAGSALRHHVVMKANISLLSFIAYAPARWQNGCDTIVQERALPCGKIGPMTLKVVLMTTKLKHRTVKVVLRDQHGCKGTYRRPACTD